MAKNMRQEQRVDLIKELTEIKEAIREQKSRMNAMLDGVHTYSETTTLSDGSSNPHRHIEKCEEIANLNEHLQDSKQKLAKYQARREEINAKLSE